jgi:hypothetical protein
MHCLLAGSGGQPLCHLSVSSTSFNCLSASVSSGLEPAHRRHLGDAAEQIRVDVRCTSDARQNINATLHSIVHARYQLRAVLARTISIVSTANLLGSIMRRHLPDTLDRDCCNLCFFADCARCCRGLPPAGKHVPDQSIVPRLHWSGDFFKSSARARVYKSEPALEMLRCAMQNP